jgi:NAD(P)-dependent dehydrogenase (short-subunit alcohol dehydrogenase family)
MTRKTIFITGASSGLGKTTAKFFAEQGWNVAATMRTPEKETELTNYPNIQVFKLDITDVQQAKEATAAAIAAFGRIDVVLNNAGMGVYGPLELAKEEDIDWQFAVNARGAINMVRSFLPHFREAGGGMFINISSFMGITTAVPMGSLYNMSKFALEGLTEGLYYELKPLNIELRLIEQGGMKENNFVNSVRWNTSEEITVYNEQINRLQALMANPPAAAQDETIDVSKAIFDLATHKSNQFRTVFGQAGNGLMAMRNSMPIEDYLEKVSSMYA